MKESISPASDATETHDQTTRLQYIQWNDIFATEKPYEVLSNIPDGFKNRNFTMDAGPEQVIGDIRGREDSFGLDENGFEVRQNRLETHSFDKESIEKHYLPAIRRLLEDVDPGAEVYIFDWRVRSSDKTKSPYVPGATVDLNDSGLVLQPVQAVHVDQSPGGAVKRVVTHMGERAQDLLSRRFRIINVWRPLENPIEDFPLAVCDGSTVSPTGLLTVDHVRKHYVGESLYPLYRESLRWYFLSGQTRDEVLLFKTYDSSIEVKAKCCPHTSFRQSGVRPDAKPRESIEVRALVFSA